MAFEASIRHAFEVTAEDVAIAMGKAGVEVGMDEADRIFAEHVEPRISDVAMVACMVDGIDDQVETAQDYIATILREDGVLPQAAPTP